MLTCVNEVPFIVLENCNESIIYQQRKVRVDDSSKRQEKSGMRY